MKMKTGCPREQGGGTAGSAGRGGGDGAPRGGGSLLPPVGEGRGGSSSSGVWSECRWGSRGGHLGSGERGTRVQSGSRLFCAAGLCEGAEVRAKAPGRFQNSGEPLSG